MLSEEVFLLKKTLGFPMATIVLSLPGEPLGRRVPRRLLHGEVGGTQADMLTSCHWPHCAAPVSKGGRNRQSKGERSEAAWAGPWTSEQGLGF